MAMGDQLTRRNRLVQSLMQQEQAAPPITTHAQGLASLLRQGLAGFNQNLDAEEQQAAMQAIMAGAQPQFGPDTPAAYAADFSTEPEAGTGPGTGQQIAGTGGYGGMLAAAQTMPDNPYARRLAQQLTMQQVGTEAAASQAAIARKQEMEDFEKKLALKQRYPSVNAPTGRPAAPIQNFARRQELVAKFKEGSPQVRQFDNYVRAQKTMNLGGSQIVLDPADPSTPAATHAVTLKPGEKPEYKREVAVATAIGSAIGGELGDAKARLSAADASMPRLEDAVTKLKALGEVATYTVAGQVGDIALKETGQDPTVGAIARSTYIAHVKNNVLPLLRQTFGAAFTAAEGDSLLATLGDPDMHPREKEAVLNAFISDKRAELAALRRQTGGNPLAVTPAAQQPGSGINNIPPPPPGYN